jgi:hypothetical protein
MASYDVAVNLVLTGGIIAALETVSVKMLGIHAATMKVQQGITGWGAALTGFTAALAGAGIVKMMYDISTHADKTANAIARMKLQGMPTTEIDRNITAARGIGIELGVGMGEAMETLNRLSAFTKSPEVARNILKPVLQMGQVLEGLGKEGGVERVEPLIKLLEETNLLQDPKRKGDLDKMFERLTKTMSAQGGTVTPEQVQLAAVYMRAARHAITSPEALSQEHPFITDILPTYLQMTGRSGQGGGGSALMSMYSKVHGMGLSKFSKQVAKSLGLLEGGHLKNVELFDINPYEWAQQELVKQLKAHGYTDPLKQQSAISSIIQRLMGTRLAADPAIEFALTGRGYRGAESPWERAMEATDRATGLAGARQLQETSPDAAWRRMAGEWSQFMNVLSMPMMSDKIMVLNKIGDAIQYLATEAGKVDPYIIREISEAVTTFGAAIGVIGASTVLGFAMTRLIGLPGMVIAVGTSLLTLSDNVRNAWDGLKDAIGKGDKDQIIDAGLKLSGAVIAAMVQGLDWLVDKITPTVRAIWDRLGNAILEAIGNIDRMIHPTDAFRRSHPYFQHTPEWRKQYHDLPTIDPMPLFPKLGSAPGSGSMFAGMGGGLLQPAVLGGGLNLGGGGGSKTVQVHNVIYLDGQAIARSINDYNIAGMEHPTQAPYFDGRAGYTSPDHQPITA